MHASVTMAREKIKSCYLWKIFYGLKQTQRIGVILPLLALFMIAYLIHGVSFHLMCLAQPLCFSISVMRVYIQASICISETNVNVSSMHVLVSGRKPCIIQTLAFMASPHCLWAPFPAVQHVNFTLTCALHPHTRSCAMPDMGTTANVQAGGLRAQQCQRFS